MQSYFSQLSILKDRKITTELRNAVLMVFICTIEMLIKIGEHLKDGRRSTYFCHETLIASFQVIAEKHTDVLHL